jgi:hypothetical protein
MDIFYIFGDYHLYGLLEEKWNETIVQLELIVFSQKFNQ